MKIKNVEEFIKQYSRNRKISVREEEIIYDSFMAGYMFGLIDGEKQDEL